MKNLKAVFIAVLFFIGLFLCFSVPQVLSQDESGDDSVVTNEIRDSAGNTVNAQAENVSTDNENQEDKSSVSEDNSANGGDSDQGEDNGEVKKDEEEQPKPQSKNLYERRGRLPPVPR